MKDYIREPINGLTHLFGAIISFIGLLALVIKTSYANESLITIMSVIIFGISMILLYSASATYHMVIAKEHVIKFFRKIDHSMIFVLIAGTYTPIALISIQGTAGWVLFTIIHTLALLGVLYKLIWFHAKRWISTFIYIAMGWLVIFFISTLASVLGAGGMWMLVLGGVFYTIGGVIYWLKPKWLEFKYLGHHEIFHIFVMLGSLFHFLCVFFYVI